MIPFHHSHPFVELAFILWLIAYSMVGAVFWESLRDTPKAREWNWFLGVFGGPCIWGFLLVRGVVRLRRRILARFGVDPNYTCGCGHRHD